MRAKYRYRAGKAERHVPGTNGLLLGAIVFGTCFASFRFLKFGTSFADFPLLIAMFAAITSRTDMPYRQAWAGKLKPMMVSLYGYVLVALLPIVSGGGFNRIQLAKDLFSFAIFPITYMTISRVVNPERIDKVLRIAITASVVFVSFSVITGVGARNAGVLGSPNLGGNWTAGAIILILLIDLPKNPAVRAGLISMLVLASINMASLGGILCTVTALAYWLPRRSKSLTLFKQVLPFLIAVVAPSLLQAFDTYTGLNRYNRSSQGRLAIWGDAIGTWYEHPLGLGIGNFSDPGLQLSVAPEAHNDYISSLVEMGVLGPLAIGAICLSIATMGGLRTRTMVVFYLVSAISHNSINFRHIWVFMAVCFAYDVLPQLQPEFREYEEESTSTLDRSRSRRWRRTNHKTALATK